MGGEKRQASGIKVSVKGSPPRGRGKDLSDTLTSTTARDHPRVGGEKIIQAYTAQLNLGSPPRGRGKEFVFLL